ncbi:MAG: SRPBCC family protein [Candidatus Acidiferrales bacterium]|jgi:uncharacterized protein YndB with AHSA1/START domain
MALKILIAIVAVIVMALVFAAMKPDTLRIERSTVINAPPDKVYALIDDFHEWPRWAPQDREDASMKRTYSGAQSGVGAVSDWSGSGNTGKGRMEITGADASRQVVVTVDFAKPFVAHNVNTFTLAPEGNGTRVSWAMQGTNAYTMKVMSLVMNMDKMMGQHFESGLANLKAAAEK